MLVVAIPGLGAQAIKAPIDPKLKPCTVSELAKLVDGPPMRCITPYSRSHAIYLWVNEEAKEELMTRNFEVNEQFANNPLYGTVVFTSWDGNDPQPLSQDQTALILDKLKH